MPLFRDNFLSFRVKELGRIRPNECRSGIVFVEEPVPTGDPLVMAEPTPVAVRFQINTMTDPFFVVLAFGGMQQRVELVPYQTPIGVRYWFSVAGERANKIFFVPQIGFVTRESIGLKDRICYLAHKKARKLTRLRIGTQLKKSRPAIRRQLELESRLEKLNQELR